MAAKVENRMARAFPFFKIETLAIVIPTFSVSSVTLIFLLASITSMLTIIDIPLYRQIILGFNVQRVLQKLLEDRREDAGDEWRKDKDESEHHSARGVVFVGHVDDVRHSRGIEYAADECAIFNILYRLYRQFRKSGVFVDVPQEKNSLVERVEKRYGRYSGNERSGKEHSCVSRDGNSCDDYANPEHRQPDEVNHYPQEKRRTLLHTCKRILRFIVCQYIIIVYGYSQRWPQPTQQHGRHIPAARCRSKLRLSCGA